MPSCRQLLRVDEKQRIAVHARQNAAHPNPALLMAGRKVIVIGYSANRCPEQLYRDLGATGDGRRGRRMKFDYSHHTSNPPSRKPQPPTPGRRIQATSPDRSPTGTGHAAGRRSSTRGTPPDPQPPALEARGETQGALPSRTTAHRETTRRPGHPGQALRVATRAWTTQPARGIAPHCRPRRKITSPKCVVRQPQWANRVNFGNLP